MHPKRKKVRLGDFTFCERLQNGAQALISITNQTEGEPENERFRKISWSGN